MFFELVIVEEPSGWLDVAIFGVVFSWVWTILLNIENLGEILHVVIHLLKKGWGILLGPFLDRFEELLFWGGGKDFLAEVIELAFVEEGAI